MTTEADLTSGIITFLTGGGFLGLVTFAVKAYRSRRAGLKAINEEMIDDIGRDRRIARRDARFWATISGGYARQLRAAGIEPSPPDPVPPSERANGNGNTPPDGVKTRRGTRS